MMGELLIIFLLLAVGFGAGYGTREMISRNRHAEYLKHRPSSPRPPLSERKAMSESPGTNPRGT
jgi:hypothetical protein